MGIGRSVGPNQLLKEGQYPPVRWLCEGRANRGLVPIGEAPDSVRYLSRVPHPSVVNRQGCRGELKARPGTKRTLEVKRTSEEEQ